MKYIIMVDGIEIPEKDIKNVKDVVVTGMHYLPERKEMVYTFKKKEDKNDI